MAQQTHDVVVIGAGPGGYVAAIRAAQLGLSVACVDREKVLGGTCLRIGCIPSKALLESSEHYAAAKHDLKAHGVNVGEVTLDLPTMMKRKEAVVRQLTNGIASLFKKNKITAYEGRARIAGLGKVIVEGAERTEITAKHIILATGSKPATIKGVEFVADRIGSSTEALSYPEVPEHLVVIGAGYIGLELGSVWQRLGAKVTVLEYLDRILPGMDLETAREAEKVFKKQGIEFRLGSKVVGATVEGNKCTVVVEGSAPIVCDRVLVSVGRTPNTTDIGLETVNIVPDARGYIPIDGHFATAAPNIYAIGDIVRGPMLAHKAEEEGVACAEHIAGGYGHVNYDCIPGIVYTHPEIATVGKSEEQLTEAGIAYRKGVFPFMANGRAKALAQTDGRVKILADAKTDRVLGVHIIGPRAGDLIAEAVAAMEFGASSEDIARTCHAHPTLAEVMKEAALAVAGREIHM
ncbi:MAG: dihydrolipoyl dehydrogenase [Candidatus Hydrogenedentes bacterium]|nr:dihydrolipoyl dehydrogenase [Candidatus Hydrogenedentota bacterium]